MATSEPVELELDNPSEGTYVNQLQHWGLMSISVEDRRGRDIIGAELLAHDANELRVGIRGARGDVLAPPCPFARFLQMQPPELYSLAKRIIQTIRSQEPCLVRRPIMLKYWHGVFAIRNEFETGTGDASVLNARITEELLIPTMEKLSGVSEFDDDRTEDEIVTARMRTRNVTDELLHLSTHLCQQRASAQLCIQDRAVATKGAIGDAHAARRLARQGGTKRIQGISYDINSDPDSDFDADFQSLDRGDQTWLLMNPVERLPVMQGLIVRHDKNGNEYMAKPMEKEMLDNGFVMKYRCEHAVPKPSGTDRPKRRRIDAERRMEYERRQMGECGLTSLEQADLMMDGAGDGAPFFDTGYLAWGAKSDRVNPNCLHEFVEEHRHPVLAKAMRLCGTGPAISDTAFNRLRRSIGDQEKAERMAMAIENAPGAAGEAGARAQHHA